MLGFPPIGAFTKSGRQVWRLPRFPGPSASSRALFELCAMFALIQSYIWGWQGAFTGASSLVLVLYLALGSLSHARRQESAAQLGLRFDNFTAAIWSAARVVVPTVLVVRAVGGALGSLRFSWREMPDLAWLVIWGTLQQYGLLCFFYPRFRELTRHAWQATIGAAGVFAAFHAPNPFLMIVTLIGGIAACALARRTPNVFALGIAHAVVSFVLMNALPYEVTHGLRVGPGYFRTN